jgi:hypothetical protein
MARLIGINGSTQGVRLSAKPPSKTRSRTATVPRPSNGLGAVTPFSAFFRNVLNSPTPRYPPAVAATEKRASRPVTSATDVAGEDVAGAIDCPTAEAFVVVGISPRSRSARTTRIGVDAGTIWSVHAVDATAGKKHRVSSHA